MDEEVTDGGCLSDYDYVLPEGSIAQAPLPDRAASRMLWLDPTSGVIRHLRFRDLVDLLEPGDLLVLNDTRVTARRLVGRKPTGGQVEVLVLGAAGGGRVTALVRPGRRLREGARIEFANGIQAEVCEIGAGGVRTLQWIGDPTEAAVAALLESGETPLPPYFHGHLADEGRYQTVYASTPGSAAAPTAGLHFTDEILGHLHEKGIRTATVTLDVGLDTFKPVQADELDHHSMHGEACTLPPETADAIEHCTGRIIAVGTTTVRTLETFAVADRRVGHGTQVTSLFIRPGYRFRIVDGMLTNFHLPRTTMLMMISAMAGRENVLSAYDEAIEKGYRFLSFGDAMLILALRNP